MAKYKEPWEKTKKEYKAFRNEGINWSITTSGPGVWGKRKWGQRSVQLHRDSIERAIANGRSVPDKVLRDYPDLKRKAKKRR